MPLAADVRAPAALRGSDAEFDEFVRAHRTALLRYAILLCGTRAPAEDIVQDVLVRMYRRWAMVDVESGTAVAYARRAVTNEFVSWRRRWSTRHIHFVDTRMLSDVLVEPDRPERDDVLWQRLRELSPRQRAAIVLRFYEGCTDDDIAAVLGCGASTVRSNVSRGLATLRARLVETVETEEGDDD